MRRTSQEKDTMMLESPLQQGWRRVNIEGGRCKRPNRTGRVIAVGGNKKERR